MDVRNVTVAGGGVLGSQIAFQSAYKGLRVTVWLRNDDAIHRAKEKVKRLHRVHRKEQPGYLLNSMLVPFLDAAEALLANGVADVEAIDAAWTLGTGAPLGPFRILGVVGLVTAYNIVAAKPQASDPNSDAAKVAAMLSKLIDEGKTGVAAGEGFYKY